MRMRDVEGVIVIEGDECQNGGAREKLTNGVDGRERGVGGGSLAVGCGSATA